MSSIKIYENKTFKLNNVLKYELHSADENVKALHRVGTVCRREWQNKTKRRGGTHIWICVMMEHCQLLLAYLAGFLLKVKNMVKCILDLIQKRKNSLGIW